MICRAIVFATFCFVSAGAAQAQVSYQRDDDNSRVEKFSRAYRFCKAIIADKLHPNPASAMNTDELAECAIDISLRELGNTGVDDLDCLRSIGTEWTELLALLSEKNISDTGVALHLRNYVLNYVHKCDFERKEVD